MSRPNEQMKILTFLQSFFESLYGPRLEPIMHGNIFIHGTLSREERPKWWQQALINKFICNCFGKQLLAKTLHRSL
jgi:hypothetical protein